jgi:hypothetical protein
MNQDLDIVKRNSRLYSDESYPQRIADLRARAAQNCQNNVDNDSKEEKESETIQA